jgi:hypothetical protein
MGDNLITVDNTRLLSAHMTNTPVQALVHGAADARLAAMAGRFGNATTWGEAVIIEALDRTPRTARSSRTVRDRSEWGHRERSAVVVRSE